MDRSLILFVLIAVSLVVTSTKAIAEPSPDLVQAWSQDWQNRTDKIVDQFVDRFDEPLRHSLDAEALDLALSEFRDVFSSAVTWDIFSGIVIDSIVSQCDPTTLDKVEPYVAGRADFSKIDKTLLQDYAVCLEDAMSYAESAAVYAMVGKAQESRDVIGKYETVLSNSNYQRISSIVTTASVEEKYGESLDEVISLHGISSSEDQQRRVSALKFRFSGDPSVLHVSLQDPGHPGGYGQVFYFYRDDKSPPGKSCHGASPPEQKGLIRCSWDGDQNRDDNVIKYSRRFDFDGENLGLQIEFDYEELLKALSD